MYNDDTDPSRCLVPVRHGKNMLEFISEDDDKGIALSSQNLESLFENGIPVRRLTELCGESGTGKTQIWYEQCCTCIFYGLLI